MKIIYTKHALLKLDQKESKTLRITKYKINKVLKDSKYKDKSIYPYRNTGPLNENHSLCVIYKIEKSTQKVITFYPAEKGRYESKIL